MKIAIAILFLCEVVSSSFDLYDVMDDARSAIESFYDPVYVQPQVKAKPVQIPKAVVTSSVDSIVLPKFTMETTSTGGGDKVVAKPLGAMVLPKFTTLSRRKTDTVAELPKAKVLSSSIKTKRVWGGSRRRRSSSRPVAPVRKLAIKPTQAATRPAPSRRVSLNKFAEAIEDIEKALADAQNAGSRVKHDERRLSKLKDLIKTAIEKRSYRFARKAIGEAMFTIRKINEQRKSGRGKRNTLLSSKDFLGSVRRKIGVSAFNDLLAMQGQVTLMFAIDDTGSMSEEIAAAKKIAKSIVDQQRTEPVDYILSPYNDPGTGPVTYCTETERDRFVKAIESLRPHGGGNCPELTFKGMIDAIDEGPQPDSPLYVFTDAGPRDATSVNIDYLREIAQVQGLVINFFFVQTSGCARNADISSFQEIAQETLGQVFELKDAKELEALQGLTATSLGGTAVVANAIQNQSTRKKRSISNTAKTYSIPVDDSIDTLVISVTADQSIAGGSSWDVSLTSPTGSIAGVATNHLDQGTVYQISKPNVGIWNLGIKTNSGVNYDFIAKGSSADNIDFEYYFVRTISRRRVDSTIPIPSPLLGKEAEAILTLGGVANVDHKSLKAELVTLEGAIIQTSKPVSLTSKDKKGIRYSFKFFPPNQIFKIKLKGRTKKGNSFERICHKPIKPETLLVKVVFARNDYTMAQGSSGYVIFMIENFGDDEVVDIKSFGSLGTVERQSRYASRVRKGRRTSFSVSFRGNTKATKGVTVTIVVSVKGKNSGSKSVMSVPLLVV